MEYFLTIINPLLIAILAAAFMASISLRKYQTGDWWGKIEEEKKKPSEKDSPEIRKPHWLVVTALGIMMFFILRVVYVSLTHTTPTYDITIGVILLLTLATMIILSGSFHTLSFGRLLTLSNEVRKTRSENSRLIEYSNQLQQAIINVSSSQQASQNVSVQSGGIMVKPSGEDSQSGGDGDDLDGDTLAASKKINASSPTDIPAGKKEAMKSEAINRFVSDNELPAESLVRNVKLTQMEDIDPITNLSANIDGYVNTPEREYFIEVASSFKAGWGAHLYVRLAQLKIYSDTKEIPVELHLLLINHTTQEKFDQIVHGVKSGFKPAIITGLLRVHPIEFTKEQIEALIDE